MNSKIVGILNLTNDSFSDGGLYINYESAINKVHSLIKEGSNIIDLGAESSYPNSQKISFEKQCNRLIPIIKKLKTLKIPISVDTYQPKIMKVVLDEGIEYINDITGLENLESIELIIHYKVKTIIMFSKNKKEKAIKNLWKIKNPINTIMHFFEKKINYLISKGISPKQIILDPGMGFFLSSNPEPSLKVLKNIKKLKTLNYPIYISTSRKSFIGDILNKSISQRSIGTLTTEIWAYLQGVDYIRTHEPYQLFQAIKMLNAIIEND